MPRKKFTLTSETYFSKDRPHISNSQITDYLKSPAFYKKKYIDKKIEFNLTDPMKVGLMVDAILTQPKNNYFQKKVLKRDDPTVFATQKTLDDRYLLTPTNYDKAANIASYIDSQPFWKQGLKNALFQQVLEGKLNNSLVCGLPDRIDPLGDQKWRMTDVKVVSAMKISSPQKWLWNCLEMGYIRQAAMYRMLWAQKQGIPTTNIDFYHAVGTQVQEGLCQVKLYKLPESFIMQAEVEIDYALTGIKDKDFKDVPVTWGQAERFDEFAPADDSDEGYE